METKEMSVSESKDQEDECAIMVSDYHKLNAEFESVIKEAKRLKKEIRNKIIECSSIQVIKLIKDNSESKVSSTYYIVVPDLIPSLLEKRELISSLGYHLEVRKRKEFIDNGLIRGKVNSDGVVFAECVPPWPENLNILDTSFEDGVKISGCIENCPFTTAPMGVLLPTSIWKDLQDSLFSKTVDENEIFVYPATPSTSKQSLASSTSTPSLTSTSDSPVSPSPESSESTKPSKLSKSYGSFSSPTTLELRDPLLEKKKTSTTSKIVNFLKKFV